jgi:hypothetical protein
MSKNEFHLEDIVSKRNFYLQLEPEFLKNILLEVANARPPYKDRQLAEMLGLKINLHKGISTSIRQWFQNKRSIPSSKLGIILELNKKISWMNVERKLISIKTGNGPAVSIRPNFPIQLNKNLGLLVGHIIGDGSVDGLYTSVFFSNSNRDLLIEFHNITKEVFNLEPRIWLQESGNFKTKTRWIKKLKSIDEVENNKCYGIFCNKIVGELLFTILGRFAFGSFKKIPDITFTAPEEFRIGIVRAFFDDECTVSESRVIRVFQDDENMLEDVRKILFSLDILPGEIHSYIKKGKRRFYFNISGLENLIRYRETIGISHSEKRKNLDSLIERLQGSKTSRLRIGQTKSLVLEFLGSGPLSTSDVRNRLKSSYPHIKWKDNVVRNHLFQLENEGKVSRYKAGKSYFWNLLMP